MTPEHRTRGLVIKELGDETLVYDLERHRAHCLNRAAALVFRGSDGRTSVRVLARRLRRELDAPADEAWVLLAIRRLRRARLLEEVAGPQELRVRVSRRELLRRVGLTAGALLPLVTTLVAPTAAQTFTCVVGNAGCSGQPFATCCNCGNPADCCMGCACDGFGACKDGQGAGVNPCPGTC